MDSNCAAPNAPSLPSVVSSDALARAAALRIEAELLRGRARETELELVRSGYLDLAARWTAIAAHLETGVLDHAVV